MRADGGMDAACGAGDLDWSKVNSGECKSFKDIDTHAHTHKHTDSQLKSICVSLVVVHMV